jgi:hypothetical protein
MTIIITEEMLQKSEEFFEEFGFAPNGKVYIVLGNTYPIKEELKAKGARYHEFLGWHFSKPVEGYPLLECNPQTVIGEYDNSKGEHIIATLLRVCCTGELCWQFHWELYGPWLKRIRYEYLHRDVKDAGYVGIVGERRIFDVRVTKIINYESQYSDFGGMYQLIIFEDRAKHVFVWRTSTFPDIRVGDTVQLVGTIKEHSEYFRTKQTVLTRCRIHEVEAAF